MSLIAMGYQSTVAYKSMTYKYRIVSAISVKKGILKNTEKFRKPLCQSFFFFIKVTAFRLILGNFYKHLNYRIPLGDCF